MKGMTTKQELEYYKKREEEYTNIRISTLEDVSKAGKGDVLYFKDDSFGGSIYLVVSKKEFRYIKVMEASTFKKITIRWADALAIKDVREIW